jgi:hypothetical protein
MGSCATAELCAGLDTSFKQLLNQSRGPMDHSNDDGHFEGDGIAGSVNRGQCMRQVQHKNDSSCAFRS